MSGASGLIFETLWFRLSGLAFGNSVWASSLVLASFMGGLAIGNAISVKYGELVRNPVRFYAILEILIALTGMGLVYFLPVLTNALVPLFHPFMETPLVLNSLRLFFAFSIMLIPAAAMGMTLPVLVKALHTGESDYGQILGRLYGINTLGAVLGTVVGDTFLISWLGITGTGLTAALLNCLAAALALMISRTSVRSPVTREPRVLFRKLLGQLRPGAWRLLAASFLAGGILLALEMVWFRFLLLFFNARSLVFSIMLGVVLAGIGLGGLATSWLLQRRPTVHRHLPTFFLISGTLVIILYGGFSLVYQGVGDMPHIFKILSTFAFLMLPASLLSGMIFALIGERLYDDLRSDTSTTGLLTLCNTSGAMVGAFLSGFVLIPELGMEKSFFLLALLYGVGAVLVLEGDTSLRSSVQRLIPTLSLLIFIASALFFPFGTMEGTILPASRAKVIAGVSDIKTAAVREGQTETIQYLRKEMFGKPLSYRLMTNNHSMSGTNIFGRRYMKLFVYLPMAIHPQIERALLISFGVGSTAKSLTDSKELKHIDIVDISKDILDLSSVVFPGTDDNPLNDPRVNVHVEDGRYFLQTTSEHYDLITAEPPPLKNSGVVNLYTEEYFQLLRDHLNPGGMVTYWLPVYQLRRDETNSTIKGFCNAFPDCSLWRGSGLELIMFGTRDSKRRVTYGEFVRQWEDVLVKQEMSALGLEVPQLLATLIVADTEELARFTKGNPPLRDNYPMRIQKKTLWRVEPSEYAHWTRDHVDLGESPTIKRFWPPGLLQESKKYLSYNPLYLKILSPPGEIKFPYPDLHRVLTTSELRFPVLLLLRSTPDIQKHTEMARPRDLNEKAVLLYHQAVNAVAERDFARAERTFALLHDYPLFRNTTVVYHYRIYLLLLMEEKERARDLIEQFFQRAGDSEALTNREYWHWLESTFGSYIPEKYKRPGDMQRHSRQ